MVNIILYKKVENKERFYQLIINKNLFNQYVLERIYGNTSFSKPVGVVYSIYEDYLIAKKELIKIYRNKLKKGYTVDRKMQGAIYEKSTKR